MTNYYSEKSQLTINEIIEDNLELVKKIAWQIFGRVQKVVEIEDLIQQGMEGLVAARNIHQKMVLLFNNTLN